MNVFSFSILCGFITVAPAYGQTLGKDLWLPRSKAKYYPSLITATKSALALPDCINVYEATIDLEQSQPEHPIFRINCIRENGKTYNEMVDGLTFEALTTVLPTEEERQAFIRSQEYEYTQYVTGACAALILKELDGINGIALALTQQNMAQWQVITMFDITDRKSVV